MESDAAMGTVETPRRENEKVPPRAGGLGRGRTRGPGAGGEGRVRQLGARRGPGVWGGPRGSRPRGVWEQRSPWAVGAPPAAGVVAEARTGRNGGERQVSHVVPEPGCPAPGAQSWKVRPPRFGSGSAPTPGQCVRGGNCKVQVGPDALDEREFPTCTRGRRPRRRFHPTRGGRVSG